MVALNEWLEENMSKGFIHQSLSPFAAPVVCAKKPDEGLRFCIDYRDINSKSINNEYPFPSFGETLILLRKARVYTKLDVRGAYNLIQVKEGDEHNSAFRTRYGLCEPMVMQFGTTNAPADFQGYIINTIREALDDFPSADLDDRLIYSDSEEEHIEHVKWVMNSLLEAGLYLTREKCEFHMETA